MLYVLICLHFLTALNRIYFHETFESDLDGRWVYSTDTSVTHGVFTRVEREQCSDGCFAIRAANKSSFYHVSAKFPEILDLTKKALHFQYVIQYDKITCGGAYVKMFRELNQKALSGTSPYDLMVGPDVCGHGTRKNHLILSHKGVNYPMKSEVPFEVDDKLHLVDLYIGVDKTFHLKLDGVTKVDGRLEDHFEYLPPKHIDDPKDFKPEDWVDEEMMVDPKDSKPEDWDDRKHVPDPNATKPEDWDDENDGEWEVDMIDNPLYKGEWQPKKIKNPLFKGVWKPRQIDNPDYKPDTTFADYKLGFIGIDIWTVDDGLRISDIFVSDDATEAEAHAKKALEFISIQNKAIEEAEKTSQPPVDAQDGMEDGGAPGEGEAPEADEDDSKDEL